MFAALLIEKRCQIIRTAQFHEQPAALGRHSPQGGNVASRRRSKHSRILAAELRRTLVANLLCGRLDIRCVCHDQSPRFEQTDVGLAVIYGVHSIPGQLAAAGAVCYAFVIIIGVPTCVRINKQIADWSIQNPPREWAQMRARWLRFHVIRTLFSVPALAIYLLAVMSHTNYQ